MSGPRSEQTLVRVTSKIRPAGPLVGYWKDRCDVLMGLPTAWTMRECLGESLLIAASQRQDPASWYRGCSATGPTG